MFAGERVATLLPQTLFSYIPGAQQFAFLNGNTNRELYVEVSAHLQALEIKLVILQKQLLQKTCNFVVKI